jgi:23S rRNA (cytidine1920-2'-O)/16S rRNA (cytidine1409-2'-O)-methyltransferase
MDQNARFVSRAGEKLQAALDAFGIDVAGRVCADFGCNVGGFTDCLLQRGAAKVFAIDTGYGELAWKLRKDPRVVVMERTNALYCPVAEQVDFVVIDVAWTCQSLVVPAARKWLKSPNATNFRPRIVSLLKPHYELAKIAGRKPHEVLSEAQSREVCLEVCSRLNQANIRVSAVMPSVLLGKGGNREFILLLEEEAEPA